MRLLDHWDLAYIEERLSDGEPLRAATALRLIEQHRHACAQLGAALDLLDELGVPDMPIDRLPDHAEIGLWLTVAQVREVRAVMAAVEAGEEASAVLAKTGGGA